MDGIAGGVADVMTADEHSSLSPSAHQMSDGSRLLPCEVLSFLPSCPAAQIPGGPMSAMTDVKACLQLCCLPGRGC